MRKYLINKKREITLIIIIAMVLILFFMGTSQAKAISVTNINVSGKVAEPIIELETGESVEITKDNKNGILEFKVKNYGQDEKITEVEMKYYLEILGNDSDNILFELKKEKEEIKIDSNKTEMFIMGKNQKEEHNYSLEIIYNEAQNREDILEEIELKIVAYQNEGKV